MKLFQLCHSHERRLSNECIIFLSGDQGYITVQLLWANLPLKLQFFDRLCHNILTPESDPQENCIHYFLCVSLMTSEDNFISVCPDGPPNS